MTAATITSRMDGCMAFDHAVLTLTDGETYITRLSNPEGAALSIAEAAGTAGEAVNLDYALSSRTFTIRFKSKGVAFTDKKVSILVWGRL